MSPLLGGLKIYYSGTSVKGPSEKRTASLERTVYIVPKLSFPIEIITFLDLREEDNPLYSGQNGWSQSVLYSEVPLYWKWSLRTRNDRCPLFGGSFIRGSTVYMYVAMSFLERLSSSRRVLYQRFHCIHVCSHVLSREAVLFSEGPLSEVIYYSHTSLHLFSISSLSKWPWCFNSRKKTVPLGNGCMDGLIPVPVSNFNSILEVTKSGFSGEPELLSINGAGASLSKDTSSDVLIFTLVLVFSLVLIFSLVLVFSLILKFFMQSFNLSTYSWTPSKGIKSSSLAAET